MRYFQPTKIPDAIRRTPSLEMGCRPMQSECDAGMLNLIIREKQFGSHGSNIRTTRPSRELLQPIGAQNFSVVVEKH
ncbi:MAG: hypothetical protein BGP04_25030 [Rhizobiales bacterium 62-17]|nr:MAG: hypothetical protein BGP04_25030 [Rhizobiales bacterium 62-17]